MNGQTMSTVARSSIDTGAREHRPEMTCARA
eukprot:COSAG05_NODE_5130_length_1257_cov_1.153713_2_plen_30_part_01